MAYYNPKRSSNWNYGGGDWKLSRSKIDLFMECPRCFYMDNKRGLKRPSMPSFQINKAVDNQLKNEFDAYRKQGSRHPLQEEFGIDAVPASHELMDQWRYNFGGVQCVHKPTGLLVSGAIDDLWINSKGEYIVVDYKATAKEQPVKHLNEDWHIGYKRQMEVYQWLLRQNGLNVSDTGYFVYCTGRYEQQVFDKKIEFDIELIPYIGNADWVEPILIQIKQCLESDVIPECSKTCEYCMWWNTRSAIEQSAGSPQLTTAPIIKKSPVKKATSKPAKHKDEATLF